MSRVSKDLEQIETLRHCLQLEAPISRVRSSTGFLHKVQWHDHDLYDWFLRVGLTPAKSRTIGPLAVPDELFADFFRGCIDGDGSVLVCTDTYHAAKCAHYVYERLYVSLVSASRRFLAWIQESIRRATGLSGAIHNGGGRSQRSIWTLRYAKAESIRLLGWMYYAPGIPCLARKRDKAVRFLAPLGYASALPSGDPESGGCTLCQAVENRPRPGWCNGSHAGLKIQCPRGRAGSTPAPGTIP